jgi:hypothetical protein
MSLSKIERMNILRSFKSAFADEATCKDSGPLDLFNIREDEGMKAAYINGSYDVGPLVVTDNTASGGIYIITMPLTANNTDDNSDEDLKLIPVHLAWSIAKFFNDNGLGEATGVGTATEITIKIEPSDTSQVRVDVPNFVIDEDNLLIKCDRNKQQPEATTEATTEEAAAEVDPEVNPEVGPEEATEEAAAEVDPEVNPEVNPEVGPEEAAEEAAEVDPEVNPEVGPEVGSTPYNIENMMYVKERHIYNMIVDFYKNPGVNFLYEWTDDNIASKPKKATPMGSMLSEDEIRTVSKEFLAFYHAQRDKRDKVRTKDFKEEAIAKAARIASYQIASDSSIMDSINNNIIAEMNIRKEGLDEIKKEDAVRHTNGEITAAQLARKNHMYDGQWNRYMASLKDGVLGIDASGKLIVFNAMKENFCSSSANSNYCSNLGKDLRARAERYEPYGSTMSGGDIPDDGSIGGNAYYKERK